PPTSTTVQAAGLVEEGALLEVGAVAIVPERREASPVAPPINVVAILHARAGRAEALVQELRANAERARNEAGCLQYDVHRSLDDPNLFVLYETWRSREALNAHFELPYMKAWAQRHAELVDRR